MMPRLVRRFWTHLLIAFNDSYTLDGFKKTQKKLELPDNFPQFDPQLKRDLTICNLFANQHQSMRNIARILDIPFGKVVGTLIDYGYIKDRRAIRKN